MHTPSFLSECACVLLALAYTAIKYKLGSLVGLEGAFNPITGTFAKGVKTATLLTSASDLLRTAWHTLPTASAFPPAPPHRPQCHSLLVINPSHTKVPDTPIIHRSTLLVYRCISQIPTRHCLDRKPRGKSALHVAFRVVSDVANRKYRAKKTEPTSAEPQVRMYDAPTPPYEPRAKPTEYKGTSSKPARRTSRRHAEAQEFPWNRGLNFPQARASAKWDESGYDPATLASMVMTRKQNGPILQRIDREEIDRQRKFRKHQ